MTLKHCHSRAHKADHPPPASTGRQAKGTQHADQAGIIVSPHFLVCLFTLGGGWYSCIHVFMCETSNPTHMWHFLKEHNEYV